MVSVAFGKPLLDGALLRLDCEVRAEHDAGDHLIVVGDVREIAVVDDADAASLLFYKGGSTGSSLRIPNEFLGCFFTSHHRCDQHNRAGQARKAPK
jgi:flavin reductase (DIM6/NTAB) family NADH-FMN oxidoreductase RutF